MKTDLCQVYRHEGDRYLLLGKVSYDYVYRITFSPQ